MWTTEGQVITHASRDEEENIETRTKRALAFLDTCGRWLSMVRLRPKCTVRRPIMDRCLHFSSYHPLQHKRWLVKSLMHRVDTTVSDERDNTEERSRIKQALTMNAIQSG